MVLKIKEIRESKNYTQDDVVQMTGIPKRSYVDYENGKSDIPLSKLRKIATVLNVAIGEILGETKSKIFLTLDDGKENGKENGDKPKVKETPPMQHFNMIKEDGGEYKKPDLIPLYDGGVAAGTSLQVDMGPQTEPVEYVDAGDWFRDATAAMRVHGDSMHPEYDSGSIIAMKEVLNKRLIVFGQDYVVETEEYRVLKRLQRAEDKQHWLLASCNMETWQTGPLKGRLIHEPFEVHIDDVYRLFKVLGRVVRNESSHIAYNAQNR